MPKTSRTERHPGDRGGCVKLRSSSIDDVWLELQIVLDCDGRGSARTTRRFFAWGYRALRAAMLATIRLPWRRGAHR